MSAATARRSFERAMKQIILINDEHLLNYGPEEQLENALKQYDGFVKNTPLEPALKRQHLFGFGEVAVRWESENDSYFLLSDAAASLGWPLWKACKWADLQLDFAVREQRQMDEEKGDGVLGYELMRDYVDLRLDFIFDDPEAKPDANGRRWSDAGEWLISTDRVMAMMSSCNWGKEFMDNTMDAMAHSFTKTLGANLDPAAKALFASDLTEEEAFRKAVRGPALDPDETDPA